MHLKTFKEFIIEQKEIPFDHNPKIGWWNSGSHVTLYHGTHEKNLNSVLDKGLNIKDHKTGMISLTPDPHTAHGYAAMSGVGGEHRFREAGKKAIHTPEHERVVFKLRIPKKWLAKHQDTSYGGNLGDLRSKIQDQKHYNSWKASNPNKNDHEFYAMSEIRVNKEIPSKFIRGYMKKKPVTGSLQ